MSRLYDQIFKALFWMVAILIGTIIIGSVVRLVEKLGGNNGRSN